MNDPAKNLDPAKSIIDAIGGAAVAARVTGKHISRVYRWTCSASRGGTGGVVPHEDALKLLAYARENDLPLVADDFMKAPSIAAEAEPATHEAASGGNCR